MNEEEKQLLVIDLCGRLPYSVKLSFYGNGGIPRELTSYDRYGDKYFFCAGSFTGLKVENIKPYLRSLETMTKEEIKEFIKIEGRIIFPVNYVTLILSLKESDWLNKNHFDYRGLIPMGLAIKVTKENNPYKKY